MPSKLEVSFTLPDTVDIDTFLQALGEFAGEQDVRLTSHSRSREFSEELTRLGLPMELNTKLTRLLLFGADDLCDLSEEELDAQPGIGPSSIRQINLALARARPPRALRGNAVIPVADMVETLDLFPEYYWQLRSRYRRISELTAADRVEVEALEDEIGLPFHLVQQALTKAGLSLAPVAPTRTLGQLRLTPVVADIIDIAADAGFRRNEPLGSLSARRLRAGLAGNYPAEDINLAIGRIRTVLRDYGFELPE